MKTTVKAETATYEDYKNLMNEFIASPHVKSKLSGVEFIEPTVEQSKGIEMITSLISNIEKLHSGFEERFGQE